MQEKFPKESETYVMKFLYVLNANNGEKVLYTNFNEWKEAKTLEHRILVFPDIYNSNTMFFKINFLFFRNLYQIPAKRLHRRKDPNSKLSGIHSSLSTFT